MTENDVRKAIEAFEKVTGTTVPPPRAHARPSNQANDTPPPGPRGFAQAGNNGSEQGASRQAGRFDDAGIIASFGPPYTINEKGIILINQQYFVGRFAAEHLVLHEPKENEFYIYHPTSGAWMLHTLNAIKTTFSDDFKRFADEHGQSNLIFKNTNGLLESLASLLRGRVERPGAFKRDGRVIHLINGMLHLDQNLELRPFSPDYYSRNVCPIEWEPNAQCPKFKEFLQAALESDDINLIQRWGGSLLLGGNAAQRVMILTGTAGGGKSTLMEVFENVIGPLNVYELRTAHLHERFEQARFIQKTVLTGKDVPGDFLEQEGAHVIKKLVGHDLLSAEKKGSNADIPFVGNFGVGITCNSRLRVRLDGDDKAWERRLMIVKYGKPKPKQRILNLADYLMKQEAAGILRWMVDGAIEHLKECDAIGDYRLTEEQTDRIVQLLAESDSLRLFVIDCIQESQDGTDLSTTEIISAYFDYCAERKWAPFPSKRAERNLADLMLEIHHSARGTHVMRGDKRVNGYRNVELS